MNFKNKKGDIPLTVILVLTLVLLLSALYAFVTDNRNFGDQSQQTAIMFNTLNFNEYYVTTQAEIVAKEALASGVEDSKLKEKTKEIASKYKSDIDSEGTLFYEIKNDNFKFENLSDTYLFEINGISVKSRVGDNQIVRNINYSIKLVKP